MVVGRRVVVVWPRVVEVGLEVGVRVVEVELEVELEVGARVVDVDVEVDEVASTMSCGQAHPTRG